MAKKRKPGMGSAKGAAFEREIAKKISLWVSRGRSSDLLWRSAGSGGRSTMRRKQTGMGIEYHASDIAPLHPDAAPFSDHFTLECKCYASIELRQIVYDWGSSKLAKWWAQARRDAESVRRIPLMVVKELRQPALLVVPAWPHTPAIMQLPSTLACTLLVGNGVVVFVLDDMISSVDFASFRGLYDVPSNTYKRPASDRRPTRRVPLVGV